VDDFVTSTQNQKYIKSKATNDATMNEQKIY